MTTSHLLAPNVSGGSNFSNLAIFICHLFIDGQFQIGHILYDQRVFNSELINEIQSNCPRAIPWVTTDVNQPLSSSPWKPNQNTDRVLQLTFLDPYDLPKNIDDFKEIFTFYQLFIVSSKDQRIGESHTSISDGAEVFRNKNSLILYYNSPTSSVWLQRSSTNVQMFRDDEQHKNLFDFVFGEHDRKWLLTVCYTKVYSAKHDRKENLVNGIPFFANYYHSALTASYINRTCFLPGNWTHTWEFQIIRPKMLKTYKDLTTDYDAVASKSFENVEGNAEKKLSLTMHLPSSIEVNINPIPLYPYRSMEMSVLFVYGTNFQRQVNNNVLSKLKIFALSWMNLFVVLAAIILSIIYRWTGLSRDGFISALIDAMVIVTGGGRLRMTHTFERWFFAIVSIGAFFLTAISLGPTLFPSYLLSHRSINTFQQLAEINPPFYFDYVLRKDQDLVVDMLRNKMHLDVHLERCENFLLLRKLLNISFAYITEKTLVHTLLIYGQRDIDVIEENLGSLQSPLYMTADEYIPEHVKNMIDKTTGAIMENGLHRFYLSYSTYLTDLGGQKLRNDAKDDGIQALSIDDLRGPLTFCFYLMIMTCFVFIVEVVLNQCRKVITQLWFQK